MISIRRISHATFETPDLEAQIEHYTKVTGLVVAAREKDRALLSCKVGQLALQLVKGERARCAKLAFQVAPGSDFGEIAKWLTAQGIKSDIQSDDIPGMSKSLAFQDIKDTTIELITDWKFLTPNQSVGGVAPFKFGHVAFVVPDVQAIADFYERILGFRVSDWIEDIFVFMRCNPDHHTVNFVKGKRADHAPLRVPAPGFLAPGERLRRALAEPHPDHLGTAATWPGTQRIDLSPQSGRTGGRILRRARPVAGRGPRLLRSAPVA